jgi:hypothetical protein
MKSIDPEQIERLKGHETLRYWELKTVIKKLNELDILVMLLKGAIDLAVPENCPPGSPPREMGDLDLLIHEADWDRAVQGLYELGYKPLFERAADIARFEVPGQRTFIHTQPYGRIDLHYDLNKYPDIAKYIQTNDFWKRSSQVTFNGFRALVPSITDQLWYQLVHLFLFHTGSLEELIGGQGHVWYIIRMADFHRERINWIEIIYKARQFNTEILLHFLIFGMKSKYNALSGIDVNEAMIQYVSHVWRWMIHAQHFPHIFTYAIGRFTVLTLIRRYTLVKVFSVYFNETVRGMPNEDLLAKYRLTRMPFLYQVVYILHFFRFTMLHLLAGVFYISFSMKNKKNRCIIKS